MRADPARDERELNRAELGIERAELDELGPDVVGRSAREQLVDGLGEPALLLGQLQVHPLLRRQSEDAAGEDLALDLLRAAVDGRSARVQVALLPELPGRVAEN